MHLRDLISIFPAELIYGPRAGVNKTRSARV
jgi:hypothetical protein